MHKYKYEILSVYDKNDIGIGFITRRQNIFGINSQSERWCIMPQFSSEWIGAYKTRLEARIALEELRHV